MIDPGSSMSDPMPLITNDANPWVIAICACAFLVAVGWNLFAYYRIFRLDHVRRELEYKNKRRMLGLSDGEDE